MAKAGKAAAATQWNIRGEMILSCNCTIFCPCVLSLGLHPPTEGFCQTWAAVRIDEGRCGRVDLSGINVVLMIEIPGSMSRGNWTAGLIVDSDASKSVVKSLTDIFSGRLGGQPHLMTILVSTFLDVQTMPITYRNEGETRLVSIDKILDGAISPIPARHKGENVTIQNSQYWIAPDITVAKADRSRFRMMGRNWNFAGRSAEICQLDWGNQ